MMKSSLTSWRLIKAFEGFKEKAQQNIEGKWIIGYGHIKSAKANVRITPEEGHLLLRFDLQSIEQTLNTHLHTVISQNQFDALVSLVFNIGEENFLKSDILEKMNAGEFLKSAEAFDIWRQAKIGDKVQLIDALVRRRSAEKALFLTPDQGVLQASGRDLEIHPDLAYALRLGVLSEKSEKSPIDNAMEGLSEKFANLETASQESSGQRLTENTEWPEIDIENIYQKEKIDSRKDSREEKEVLNTETQEEANSKGTLTRSVAMFSQDQIINPMPSVEVTTNPDHKKNPHKIKEEEQGSSFFQKLDLSKGAVSEFEEISTVLKNANTEKESVKSEGTALFQEQEISEKAKIRSDHIYASLTLLGILFAIFGFVSYVLHDQLSYISLRFGILGMLSGILISSVSLYFWYRNHVKDHDDDETPGKKDGYKGKQKQLKDEIKLEDKSLRDRLQNFAEYQSFSNVSPLKHL